MNTKTPAATLHLICQAIHRWGLHPHEAAALHGITRPEWDAMAADRAVALAIGKAEAEWVIATLEALCAPRRKDVDAPNLAALRWALERRFPEHWGRRKAAASGTQRAQSASPAPAPAETIANDTAQVHPTPTAPCEHPTVVQHAALLDRPPLPSAPGRPAHSAPAQADAPLQRAA